MLLLVGAWLLVRRLGGYLSEPLPAIGLLAFTFLLTAISACMRSIAIGGQDRRLALAASLAGWLPAAIAVSLPGTAPGALAVAWLVLIAGEGAGLFSPGLMVARRAPRVEIAPAAIEEPIDETLPLAAEVEQEQTRATRDGIDSLVGRIRARFAAGQKTQVLHVAFCPPFSGEPETEIELLDGDEAQVASSQAYSYGLRIELRRRIASRGGEVVVGFSAACPAEAKARPASPDFRLGAG